MHTTSSKVNADASALVVIVHEFRNIRPTLCNYYCRWRLMDLKLRKLAAPTP
jgi:hypothetical protein